MSETLSSGVRDQSLGPRLLREGWGAKLLSKTFVANSCRTGGNLAQASDGSSRAHLDTAPRCRGIRPGQRPALYQPGPAAQERAKGKKRAESPALPFENPRASVERAFSPHVGIGRDPGPLAQAGIERAVGASAADALGEIDKSEERKKSGAVSRCARGCLGCLAVALTEIKRHRGRKPERVDHGRPRAAEPQHN